MYLMKFEKYAAKLREPYSDDKTWYLYNFVTKKDYQRKGYGKSLINIFISFIKENNYRICFEINDSKNVPMYEHFGFKVVKEDKFGDVNHYVLFLE